jgi:hypothetical protein
MGNTDNDDPPVPSAATPKCKAPGIVVLVIGCLEIFSVVFIIVFSSRYKQEYTLNNMMSWWEPLLSAIGYIVSGSMAILASSGRSCCVEATVVMAGIVLSWTVMQVRYSRLTRRL